MVAVSAFQWDLIQYLLTWMLLEARHVFVGGVKIHEVSLVGVHIGSLRNKI